MSNTNCADEAYINLVRKVLEKGERTPNRTGVDTLSVFAEFYCVNLTEGYPLLTTKKVNFNSMLHELLWYISGEAHIRNLRGKTKIWDEWSTPEGELETAYGRYWRHYPLPSLEYEPLYSGYFPGFTDTKTIVDGGEAFANLNDPHVHFYEEAESAGYCFDQLAYIVDELTKLKTEPNRSSKRRLVLNAWHPVNAVVSKLPPCHAFVVFSISGNKLNCHLTQRSADLALGVPFNLACYGLFTMALAQTIGYEYGHFAHTLVDCHIYVNHIDGLLEQIERTPYTLPSVTIDTKGKSIFDLRFDDFKLANYKHHPTIKFEVAV